MDSNIPSIINTGDLFNDQEVIVEHNFIGSIINSIIDRAYSLSERKTEHPCFGREYDFNYNALVISGGAMLGFGGLGVIDYCEDQGYLKNIKKYYGTSVGSMICYLLILGHKPIDIFAQLYSNKILEKVIKNNIYDFAKGDGMLNWLIIENFLLKMSDNERFTFQEFYQKFNVGFNIVTYNLSQGRLEILNHLNTPDLDCLIGIRMSSNIPVIFPKFLYKNDIYVDGGIVNNFPIDLLEEDDIGIGIDLCGCNSLKSEHKSYEFIWNIVTAPMKIIRGKIIDKSLEKKNCDIITCKSNFGALSFSINITERLNMYSTGRKNGEDFFKQ